MLEFLSPRVKLLLLTVMVAFILILIMEYFNVELFFGGGSGLGIRAFLAVVIAIAIYVVFERISEKISHN